MISGEESQDLLDRCKRGEQSAWAAMVERFSGLVFAIARAHRLPETSCDDVAQRVFTQLWRSMHTIKEAQALAGWISTTARRECWRAARDLQRGSPSDIGVEPAVQANSDQIHRLEQAARVREALGDLGGKCQELLTALFFTHRDADYRVIAELLSMSVGSIGPSRQRCLAKLAKILEPGLS